LPLSCLILDHRLWPDRCVVVTEKARHVCVANDNDCVNERSTDMPRLGAILAVWEARKRVSLAIIIAVPELMEIKQSRPLISSNPGEVRRAVSREHVASSSCTFNHLDDPSHHTPDETSHDRRIHAEYEAVILLIIIPHNARSRGNTHPASNHQPL
jgi:hypothetical protein